MSISSPSSPTLPYSVLRCAYNHRKVGVIGQTQLRTQGNPRVIDVIPYAMTYVRGHKVPIHVRASTSSLI